MSSVLQIENLSFSYEKGKPFFSDFALTVAKNEIIGVLGANGAGKTTLFEIISGCKKSYTGTVFVDGKNLKSYSLMEKARHIAYIQQMIHPQDSYQDVFHFVLDGRRPYARLGNYSSQDAVVVEKLLADYGLWQFHDTLVALLSGGEYQRCVLARALAQQTNLVICDEPFSAMDIRYQKEFKEKIAAESQKHGTAFLVSLHDINSALQFCTKVLFLKRGKQCFYGKPHEVSCKLLEQIYDTSFDCIKQNGKQVFF